MGEKIIQEKVESKKNLRKIIFDIMCKAPSGAAGKPPDEGQRKFELFTFI